MTTTETITCNCTVCQGAAILAPVGLIEGSAKQVRELTHSYVVNAHGASPLSQMLTRRAGVQAVQA